MEQILREVDGDLRPLGFRRRAFDFRQESEECWAILNFQKHKSSTEEMQSFTVNLGVASKHVLEFEELAQNRPPMEHECCWRKRLGALLTPASDRWWKVTDAASAKSVSREVREALLTKALPKMEALMRDEELLDVPPGSWVGAIPIFRVHRYKAILAAGLGRQEEMERAIAVMRKESRGKPWEATSEATIQKLEGVK